VLVAWNGLMISAMARAGALLDEPRYVDAARAAARFCLSTMRPDGERLLATWRQGRAHLNATLADYAYLAVGLLDLFEADGDGTWAHEALSLVRVADRRFRDERGTGWYLTSDDHEQLITRPRDLFDGALPSSNGVLIEALVRLAALTDDAALRESAERALAAVTPLVSASPSAFARVLLALLRHDTAAAAVVADGPGAAALLRALRTDRELDRPVYGVPGAGVPSDLGRAFPLLAGKTARAGAAAAYLCRRGTCGEPVLDAERLATAGTS
jgi:uncharacterized protein YyaL (SSP411 family)